MKFIPDAITSKVATTVLKVQKGSPTLLFAGGVVGVVGTVVLASRATLKLEDVLESTQTKLKEVDELQHDDYSEQDRVKDRAILMVRAARDITKLYGPALILGVASISMLVGSHNILTKRNAALTAAYATIDKAFKEYRSRVVEELGDDTDRKFRYGIQTEKVTTVDETGKKVVKEKRTTTADTAYGRLFNEYNVNFQRVPEYNLLFLRGVQNMANDRLRAKGHLLLNDVYDDLGFERTSAGCVVGWVVDGDGDGYVDFGIFDDKETLRIYDYVTGHENEIYLDFNVDGIVYDKI